ncbi:ABC transporter permease [Streptomyces sp. enrichment culture]|uniref:ABC transporter permease n=1 Tax=Streptomyces sp. enrichment culture TaxID=1795815 RepID=UPI003F577EEE
MLTSGSDRGEGRRIALTAVGAALAAGCALAAGVLASLGDGRYAVPVASGVLDEPGTRSGVVVALLLLLVPVLGFLGQCARIGAVHRDRRLAGLRLAGATPAQVRRIAALETGLACAVGSVVATVCAVVVLLRFGERPTAGAWVAVVVVAVAVPVLGAVAGGLALRRVVASPLGQVRRVTTRSGRGPARLFLVSLLATAAVALFAAVTSPPAPGRMVSAWKAPLEVAVALLTVGAGAVWLSGTVAAVVGRTLARRARSAATLIAAERLSDDPWAPARTHAAVLLVTVVGTGFVGVRQSMLELLHQEGRDAQDMAFYQAGLDLTAVAIAVALAITLSGLAVGTAESLSSRRRALAAQAAAGVPRAVLNRALLLETALPLAPALLLAGIGGLVIGVGYSVLTASVVPWAALLVPIGIYAACLLAAATALPLHHRSLAPGALRHG